MPRRATVGALARVVCVVVAYAAADPTRAAAADPTSGAATVDVEPLRLLARDLTTVYYIGDLHGDATCARKWAEKTGLVKIEGDEVAWTGPQDAALVFMGDYVDKGIDSRGVLEFVRRLTDASSGRAAINGGSRRRRTNQRRGD